MAWIEKRGNKYRVYWWVDGGDKRKRNFLSFDAPDEADTFKKKLEYQESIGIVFDPVKMTFGEYLDHWLEIHKSKLAPKTYASYRCEIENHIKPHLGNIKLLRLTPMQLQNYYATIQREGKANILRRKLEKENLDKRAKKRAEKRLQQMIAEGKGGLSGTTANYHHRIIHKALKQALKWQMVGQNIADAVDPPMKNDTEIEYMKKHQVHQFINAIKGNSDYPVILAALYTGMRQGELLGLRWQDVDLEAGIIYVQQQVQYLPDKGYFFKAPKKNSKRKIPIPLPLNSALRQVKKEQEKYKQLYGEEYKDFNLVFCNPDGSPQDGTALTKRFQSLLEQNELPKMRFHSLRHTFATMCRGAGMNIEDIQDLLGHADISTTKNMYTHIEIETLKKAMSKFEEYMQQ